MEYHGKEKTHYRGIWIPFLVIIIVQLGLFFLFRGVIGLYCGFPDDITNFTAMAFACLLAFLFDLFCLFHGVFHDILMAFFRRIKETFEFFEFGSKEAFSWYFYEFINDGGPIFWLFLLIALLNIGLSFLGFSHFFSWYYIK